jgi:hypothetical protein
MKLFDELNEENFILFAAKHYYNPKCIMVDEFYEDLKRFKYIKRLLNRYLETGNLSERLLLNHFIVLFNSFNVDPSLKMLEFKLEDRHWSAVKPFLIYLNYIRNDQYIGITMDSKVVELLRKI